MTTGAVGNIKIRNEKTNDNEAIRRVHELAFDTSAEAQLVDLLHARGKATVSLVAEDGERSSGIFYFHQFRLTHQRVAGVP